MSKTEKNGIIELLRFIFASFVVFYHISIDLWNREYVIVNLGKVNLDFFYNGWIGVDFFFVLSGFLMAKSIWKRQDAAIRPSLGGETVSFLWHKVKSIYYYYLPACAVMLVLYFKMGYEWNNVIKRLPSLLFLQRTGAFPYSILSVTWYISSMLLAMLILYPICRKYYHTFTGIIGPIVGILLIGIIMHESHTLTGASEWLGITYKCNLRAIAEIALGTASFEASRKLGEKQFRPFFRLCLSLVSCVCILCVFFYAASDISGEASPYVLLLILIAVTFIFSGAGRWSESRFLQNPLFLFLGAISLPVYLFQNIFRVLVPEIFPDISKGVQCLLIYLGILCFAVIAYLVVSKIKQNRSRSKGVNHA